MTTGLGAPRARRCYYKAVSTARKCCCGGVGSSQDASGVPCARVSRRASGAADRRADDPVTRAAI